MIVIKITAFMALLEVIEIGHALLTHDLFSVVFAATVLSIDLAATMLHRR